MRIQVVELLWWRWEREQGIVENGVKLSQQYQMLRKAFIIDLWSWTSMISNRPFLVWTGLFLHKQEYSWLMLKPVLGITAGGTVLCTVAQSCPQLNKTQNIAYWYISLARKLLQSRRILVRAGYCTMVWRWGGQGGGPVASGAQAVTPDTSHSNNTVQYSGLDRTLHEILREVRVENG